MTHRQLRSYIGVFFIVVIASYLYWQENPLVIYEKELTVYDFIDESGVAQDSGKFFSN
jgi:hypothetical protein